MEDDDELLQLSSAEGEEEPEEAPRRLKLKRKLSSPPRRDLEKASRPSVEEEDGLRKMDGDYDFMKLSEDEGEEDKPPLDFGAGIFDEEEENARDAVDERVLPMERTVVLWMREEGLLTSDQRPDFPPIPLPEESVKAAKFKLRLDQAEESAPGAIETERLRKTWAAYVEAREDYYGLNKAPGLMDMLTGSTSNFSNMDITRFISVEADEDDEEEEEDEEGSRNKKKRPAPARPPGQASIVGFFNRLGTQGRPIDSLLEAEMPDEYDYEDGFVVRDGEDEEVEEEEEEEPEKDPGDLSATELGHYREKKRRKLADEEAELTAKQEELKALQQEIMDHHRNIEQLTAQLDRCDKLLGKQEQSEQDKKDE